LPNPLDVRLTDAASLNLSVMESINLMFIPFFGSPWCVQAERELAAVCRHVALKLATAKANHHASLGHTSQRAEDGEDVASSAVEEPPFQRVVVTADLVGDVLGPIKYESEVAARMGVPGVCTGLAWKPSGGELLFIECRCGEKKIQDSLHITESAANHSGMRRVSDERFGRVVTCAVPLVV
jgi:hypothetical protein